MDRIADADLAWRVAVTQITIEDAASVNGQDQGHTWADRVEEKLNHSEQAS
jgi:hypothetical protein